MSRTAGVAPAGPAAVLADAAATFSSLGLLDQAGPLLRAAGWDGSTGPSGDDVGRSSQYPRAVARRTRRALGMHYTPAPVAGALTECFLGPDPSVRVGDPACGAGVFLVAAAEALRRRGAPVDRIVRGQLFGADIDPVAVALARIRIARWAAEATGRFHAVPDTNLVVADSLAGPGSGDRWVDGTGTVEVVVGNPPFGSQLRGAAVRTRDHRERAETLLGATALGYADTATLFLGRAVDLVVEGGRVALILPASAAAARDAAPVRAAVADRTRLRAVWTGGDDVGFDASVSVWAPLLEKRPPRPGRAPLTRYHGPGFDGTDTIAFDARSASWAVLLSLDPVVTGAVAASVATSGVGTSGDRPATVESVATVGAGFRRHFYGLAPHVDDTTGNAVGIPRLVTTGAIDPLHLRTDVPVRFAGRSLARPTVDVASLEDDDPVLGAWVRSLLVPKVLVASQGRVPEAIVDRDGTLVPSTPVIAVVPRPGTGPTVWHLAAVVSSPSAALRLRTVATGTGIDGQGCRVSAGFVAGLELPEPGPDWDEAAEAARDATRAASTDDVSGWNAHLDRLGAAMTRATAGVDGRNDIDPIGAGEVLDWWREQRPRWRGARLLNR